MTSAPDEITAVDYAKSHIENGDATEGIAKGRNLAGQVESDFETFRKKLKVPLFLQDDFYQEVWRAVWIKYEKGKGINIEKYLNAWKNRQWEQGAPRTRSVDGLVQSSDDSAKRRKANRYTLGVYEEMPHAGDRKNLLLTSLMQNAPRPKYKWRSADKRREAAIAERMGYDAKAWIAYRKKWWKRDHRSLVGHQALYSGLSNAVDSEYGGTQRQWHPGRAGRRKMKVVRRKNARPIFWNPGVCGPPHVPTPVHILIAKESLVCPYCGGRLALDSAPRREMRLAGGIIFEDCKNRRWGAFCLCGFWYICGGLSPN